MVVDGGAAWTNDPLLALDISGLDGGWVHTSTDGGVTWTDWRTAADTAIVLVDKVEGEHAVWAQLKDSRETLGPAVSDSIGLDVTPPVGSAVLTGLQAVGLGAAHRIPVSITWDAADALSGLVDAKLLQECGSGPVAAAAMGARQPSRNATSRVSSRPTSDDAVVSEAWLPRGKACRQIVATVDAAGNAGRYESLAAVGRMVSEAPSTTLTYTGRWVKRSVTGAIGGSVRRTSTAWSGVSLTFTGTGIGIVSALGPGRGQARVLVDGVRVGSVDLYAPTASAAQVVFTHHFDGSGTHTITFQATGQKNAASAGVRVDTDGFVLVAPAP